MWAETGLNGKRSYEDGGSGTETSGECDDEDGCEGSGEDEQNKGAFLFLNGCKYIFVCFCGSNYNYKT